MLDWKAIIIIFGCIFYDLKVINGYEISSNKSEIIRDWYVKYNSWGSSRDHNAKIVKGSNDVLLRVINFEEGYKTGRYFIHIDQVDPQVSNKTCRIPTNTTSGIYSRYLGNGLIIGRLSHDSVLIINATDCSDRVINLGKTYSRIIPYNSTFDVLSEDKYDAVTIDRYSDKGFLEETFNNVGFEIWNSDEIFPLRENSPEKYLRIRRFHESSYSISVINSTFQIESSYKFNNRIEAYSNAHKNFSFCYHEYIDEKDFLMCHFYDWNFKMHSNVSVPIDLPRYINIGSINMHNLPGGGALVLYQMRNYVKYFHIDASGNHSAVKNLLQEQSSAFDIDIFERDSTKKIYCIIMQIRIDLYGKCIQLN